MKNYKILGVTNGVSKTGNAYTRVSIADEHDEKWTGVHAFEAFLKGEIKDLKPGSNVAGVVSYFNGSATLNV